MNPSTSKSSISTDPLYLTDFGMDSIMLYCDYVNTITAPDFSLSFTTVHAKAASMFKNKFVSNIEFIDTDDYYEIFAKVRAEMKKKVIYDVSATISKTNEVISVVCGCPGGSEPAACKHSLALLYAIESYSQKELYSAPTEQLQRWHQAKPSKTSPVKFASEIEENVSDDTDEVDYDALSDLPFTAAIFDVIDKTKYDIDEATYKKSVPLPLIVCTNVDFFGYPTNLNFKELRFFHENVKVSFEEAIIIEKNTIHQNKSNEWKNNRIKRLTSSFFFDIVKCKSDLTNLATKILNSHNNDISTIPAVKYGITNEPLVQNVIKHAYDAFNFRKTGLIINPFFPYLGASPDGLLNNSNETFLIEIKCVYNESHLDLLQLVQQRKQFCLKFENDKFNLKHNHKYMYQIQGQLAISNLNKCLFILMYKKNMPLYIEEIKFNNQLWQSMKNKLDDFYFKYYLPIIIN